MSTGASNRGVISTSMAYSSGRELVAGGHPPVNQSIKRLMLVAGRLRGFDLHLYLALALGVSSMPHGSKVKL